MDGFETVPFNKDVATCRLCMKDVKSGGNGKWEILRFDSVDDNQDFVKFSRIVHVQTILFKY